ncbi:hypothetical protein CEXT_770521, partial [Caerostris extrusa]
TCYGYPQGYDEGGRYVGKVHCEDADVLLPARRFALVGREVVQGFTRVLTVVMSQNGEDSQAAHDDKEQQQKTIHCDYFRRSKDWRGQSYL